jgi:pimeloyl-ACP methyl ester carboxylesterase
MSFAEVRGARLFFTDTGSGQPPMIFVHGFGCDSHDWSWQLAHFEPSHRVVAIDLRGHGRSSATDGGYEVASLAQDVAGVVDELDCGPVIAVGHSLGGALVAHLAVERPELVMAVVAVDPGHLLPDETGPMLAQALRAYETGDPGTVAGAAFDAGSHTAQTPRALAVWHNRRAAGYPAHTLRQTIRGLLGGPAPFVLRSNSEPYLRQLTQPVLSLYVDPARAAVAEQVFTAAGSRTVCFEGAGHWLHQERPEEVNSLIDTWLAGLPLVERSHG